MPIVSALDSFCQCPLVQSTTEHCQSKIFSAIRDLAPQLLHSSKLTIIDLCVDVIVFLHFVPLITLAKLYDNDRLYLEQTNYRSRLRILYVHVNQLRCQNASSLIKSEAEHDTRIFL